MPTTLADVRGADVAIERAISFGLQDCAFTKPCLMSILHGMDQYYGTKNLRYQSTSVEGGEIPVHMWMSDPQWRPSEARNPDYAQRVIPLEKTYSNTKAKWLASSHETATPVDVWEIRRFKLESVEELRNYAKHVANRHLHGLVNIHQSELWPDNDFTGQEYSYDYVAGGRLMAFEHGLQSGGANNDTTLSGTYNYGGLDLNLTANAGARSIQKGTTSTSWNLTMSNIRKDALIPLRLRGANPDVMFVGSNNFDYLVETGDSEVQYNGKWTNGKDTVNFGSTFVVLEDGLFVFLETGLDQYDTYERVLIGDSSTLLFGFAEKQRVSIIDKVPQMPSVELIQGYVESAFVNLNPRYWFRGFKVARP